MTARSHHDRGQLFGTDGADWWVERDLWSEEAAAADIAELEADPYPLDLASDPRFTEEDCPACGGFARQYPPGNFWHPFFACSSCGKVFSA